VFASVSLIVTNKRVHCKKSGATVVRKQAATK